jgi:hypothetical protein
VSADLGALFAQHKSTLAIGGAVVVGGLALMQARKRDAAAGGPATVGASTGGAMPYSSPAIAGYATMDTTSSDLYSSLQPQIEYLQRLAERQAEEQGAAIPVAAPKADPRLVNPAALLKSGFYKKAGSSTIYKVNSGKIDQLTKAEAKELVPKGYKVHALSSDASVWKRGTWWLDRAMQPVTQKAPTGQATTPWTPVVTNNGAPAAAAVPNTVR